MEPQLGVEGGWDRCGVAARLFAICLGRRKDGPTVHRQVLARMVASQAQNSRRAHGVVAFFALLLAGSTTDWTEAQAITCGPRAVSNVDASPDFPAVARPSGCLCGVAIGKSILCLSSMDGPGEVRASPNGKTVYAFWVRKHKHVKQPEGWHLIHARMPEFLLSEHLLSFVPTRHDRVWLQQAPVV